jgi:N-acetylneuraminic acid mutarotase
VIPSAIADPGQWGYTNSLTIKRQSHTATLLSNGQVLVAAGGTSEDDSMVSAELYDPATGFWSGTGTLNGRRTEHSATLLPNGMVLVAGGYDTSFGGGNLATAELYDPSTGAWTTTGSMHDARAHHSAILLNTGKVLVVAGSAGSWLASAELYDPATGIWSTTGSLATARVSHTATLLPNGLVLVAGGAAATGVTASAELYDPATGTWTVTGSLNTARAGHTATLLLNGQVLTTGGSNGSAFVSSELYDPATGTWTATGSLNAARAGHTATLLLNGQVLITGGSNGSALMSSELYDPATGQWSVTGSLNQGRYFHTATLLQDGSVLAAGGNAGSVFALDSVELYGSGLPSHVDGRGAIKSVTGRANFNFHVTRSPDHPIGSFSFSDPSAGVSLRKGKFDSLIISGNTASFSGKENVSGNAVSFFVSVTDNGDGRSDTFYINLSSGYTSQGNLIKGDIQIY